MLRRKNLLTFSLLILPTVPLNIGLSLLGTYTGVH